MTSTDTREKLAQRMKEKRLDELKKWGYVEGQPGETFAQAEASAEAASPPDRIVPISSLAHRRFRMEFIEPLLAVPKINGGKKAKKKTIPKSPAGGSAGPPGPKGRLARAVKELLETKGGDEEERHKLAADLAKVLKNAGIRSDHPLRKKLDKFVATKPPAP